MRLELGDAFVRLKQSLEIIYSESRKIQTETFFSPEDSSFPKWNSDSAFNGNSPVINFQRKSPAYFLSGFGLDCFFWLCHVFPINFRPKLFSSWQNQNSLLETGTDGDHQQPVVEVIWSRNRSRVLRNIILVYRRICCALNWPRLTERGIRHIRVNAQKYSDMKSRLAINRIWKWVRKFSNMLISYKSIL